jgi:CheY-like chemotaxis protein
MLGEKLKKLKSILLVDDDPITNYINHNLIKKLSITEKIAVKHNGYEALQYISTQSCPDKYPSLVILDINMPVMNGFEFLESFQNTTLPEKEKIKIIILSSSVSPRDLKRINSFNVEFISKPLKSQDLLSIIKKIPLQGE